MIGDMADEELSCLPLTALLAFVCGGVVLPQCIGLRFVVVHTLTFSKRAATTHSAVCNIIVK